MKGERTARFRFYAELNDFLPGDRRQREFVYRFNGNPSIKDAIEALGVPHPAVDVILANGIPVGFDHRLQPGDRVSVYPVFESLDVTPIIRSREKPLRRIAFILDVHLGKLARLLRMLGFDTLYRNDYRDPEIIRVALKERRMILTRDRGILKNSLVTHGYWIRAEDPEGQVREVLERFDLKERVEPFRRCMACNGLIEEVSREEVLDRLPPRTRTSYDQFHICSACGKVYWPGTHYRAMKDLIVRLTGKRILKPELRDSTR